MKIDFIGNIYIQESLQPLELQYLQAFGSSVHYINTNNNLLGLYDISIKEHDLLEKKFLFDEQINLERSILHNPDNIDINLFPFYKTQLSFSEKSIKFSFIDINNKEDFLYFIEYLSQNILFFYYHFFSRQSYCKVFNKEFFTFFNRHNLHGNVYFKLSDYGSMFRLTCIDDKISLHKGSYPTSIKGKNYIIKNTNIEKSIDLQKQLLSIYDKLSIIDIKNNALFEDEGTYFSFKKGETFDKLLQFYTLNNKLEHKTKDKVQKI